MTHHGKGVMIAPVATAVGWTLTTLDVDTDQLGSFDGEIPRRGTPLEVARAKALLGADHATGRWLLASEGTFTPGALGTMDHELVVAVAVDAPVTIVGQALEYVSRAVRFEVRADNKDELEQWLARALEGGHHVIVRTDGEAPVKGIATPVAAVEAVARLGAYRPVVIETDLRAHLCPSRAAVIAEAATDLFTRLACSCPFCGEVGFGPADAIAGRPCENCHAPTRLPVGYRWSCPWCGGSEDRRESIEPASAANCSWCNP